MDNIERIHVALSEVGGVAKTSDLNARGFYNYEIVRLVDDGVLERVKHGYYQLANQIEPDEEKIIAALFPDGAVCMYSALYHYGYSDYTPHVWDIAFPRTVSRSRLSLDYPPIEPYFVKDDLFPLGRTTSLFQGVELPVYDRERVICECFKRRNRMDAEVFDKSVKEYARDPKKDLGNLTRYAEKLRVVKNVHSLMEVLINE